MAQVNKTIYPDVSSGTYYTATKTISGSNFPGQLGIGLEKSITYTMSTNPHAPYNNLRYTHLTNDSTNQEVATTNPVQRIALLQGWPQAFGNDRCGSISYIQHPWNANFTSSSPLYSAYKWNAIVGRLCCTWYVDPTDRTFTEPNNYYNGTWKDFKDLLNQGGHEYVLVSVWLEVYGGGLGTDINDRRQAGIKGMNLYKVPIYAWDAENDYNMVHEDGFLYAPMRPMAIFGSKNYNSFNSSGSNQADCCWPVYNYGYGISGYSPDTFSFPDVRGRIIYGVDERLEGVYTFSTNFGGSNGHRTYGISSTDYGVSRLISTIEEKAACLGIIAYTDCHDTGECSAIRTDTVANVFNRPDIICPIMDREGHYNGDFITTAEEAPGTSAEDLIGGDKDAPFDGGGGSDDPTPGDGPDIYIATKDNFTIEFGVNVSENSTQHRPETNDLNNYYLTKKYRPTLRFTSRVDGTKYSVDLNKITGYIQAIPTYALDQGNSLPLYISLKIKLKSQAENNDNSFMQGARALVGVYTTEEVAQTSYAAMTSEYSTSKVSLGQLVRYFRNLNPNFTSNDVYTTLYIDYYEFVTPPGGPTGELIATRELDFSSLYGSGIDATTNNGEGSGEGHSYDPLPNKNNYDDSEYNDNSETGSTPMSLPLVSPYGQFHRTYLLTADEVKQLSNVLTTTDDSAILSILEGLKMWGANPIQAIVDLRMYPFNVAHVTNSTEVGTIVLGRYNTDIPAIKMSDSPTCAFFLGGLRIQEEYHNFLDYEPYTTISLYIPYIGTIELAPSIYMGHIVSVTLVVDFYTGAATAVVYKDGYAMTYHSGLIGTSVAVTGDDASAYANGIVGNLVGAIGSAAGAVGFAAMGDPGRAVRSGSNAIEDLFEMSQGFNNVKFQEAGSTSPAVGTWMPQQCHIVIARPQLAFETQTDLAVYGVNVGYTTAYTSIISKLKGGGIYYGVLTEHIGTSAAEPNPTAKELDMLKQILNNGFFVN